MNQSESIAKIAAALAKAQGSIKSAPKDSKNPHFNSKYADLASVVDACKEQLSLNEIAVVQAPSAEGNVVKMATTLLHSSGEWLESALLSVQARDAGPQAVGSCITYLRRYQLASMVGVAPDDDDAEAAEGRPRSGGLSGMLTVKAPPDAPKTLVEYNAAKKKPIGPVGKALAEVEAKSVEATVADVASAVMDGYSAGMAKGVRIMRIDSSPTKNANVTRYSVTLSTGEVVTTIKQQLASLVEQIVQEGLPVTVDTKQTKWGTELVAVHRIPLTAEELPAIAPVDALTQDDIPF